MAEQHSIPAFPSDIDRDSFGHWLSGFAAGEGCFKLGGIINRQGRRHPTANFSIELRADDKPILELIRSYWQCGRFFYSANDRCRVPNAKPVWKHEVHDIPSLISIVIPHFQRFPLRAKKAADFLIWKQAIELMYAVQQQPDQYRRVVNRYRGKVLKWTDELRDHFFSLVAALKEQRIYKESPLSPCSIEPPPLPEKPPPPTLFDGLSD
jgi:LAGLIDADG endonuclease